MAELEKKINKPFNLIIEGKVSSEQDSPRSKQSLWKFTMTTC